MQPGFQVLRRRSAVSAEWVEKFASIPVANISDSMSRLNAGGARLRPMHAGGVLCGPAVTVKSCPGDNLMTHMALNLAVAGDVIVVDAGGDLTNAIVGERMLAYCIAKKFAGIVIHGAVRDFGWIRRNAFPVYACGVTHQGPYKNGPGEINTPVSLAGMVVAPGDLMVVTKTAWSASPSRPWPPCTPRLPPSSSMKARPSPRSARATTTRRAIEAS